MVSFSFTQKASTTAFLNINWHQKCEASMHILHIHKVHKLYAPITVTWPPSCKWGQIVQVPVHSFSQYCNENESHSSGFPCGVGIGLVWDWWWLKCVPPQLSMAEADGPSSVCRPRQPRPVAQRPASEHSDYLRRYLQLGWYLQLCRYLDIRNHDPGIQTFQEETFHHQTWK